MQPSNGQQPLEVLLQQISRPINCLADEDRNIRKSGLVTIKKQLSTNQNKQHIRYLFTETKLPSFLAKIYGDKIQINRQLGIEITCALIDKLKDQGKNIYESLLPELIRRVNQTPFPENSQELRLMIIAVYIKLIPYKDCFYKYLPQLAGSVAKCLTDPYDMIKLSCCEFINQISKEMRHQIGKHSSAMSKALCLNLTHQKFKVRKCSLYALGCLLITESAGSNFQHCKVGIKSSLSDKKREVREAALECTAHLLQYMSYKYLKQFEAVLIGYLLVGMSDDEEIVRDKVMELLQKCGNAIKAENSDTAMIDEADSK